jgi:hypothetical protein
MALSMRRIITVLAVAATMAAMLAAMAVPAFAAHSRGHGDPNEKACQGVIIGGLAHSRFKQLPPPKAADALGYPSVKDYTEGAREGEFGVVKSYDPNDRTQCPKGE